MTKRKLFFDATPLIEEKISGVGKVLQETLKAIDTEYFASKYEMYIFVPFDEAARARKLRYNHIKLKLLPYPHKFFSLFTRMRLAPPIDLFLGRGVYIFENFRNCTLLFSRSITYVHDVAFKMYPEYIEERNLRYLTKYVPLWMKRAHKVVAVSEASKTEIEKELGLKGVVVVPNAVNQTEYHPRTTKEVRRVQERWELPEKYALFIGNIEPRKNLENTVKAFRKVVDGNNDIALVLIGGGGWRNETIMAEINQARNQGVKIIRPKGYVPDEDIPAIISGASVLLQFSWHEGFGLPVLQALACGTPVAANDTPALREAARDASKRVVFAKSPSDVDAIARAIEGAISLGRVEEIPTLPTWTQSVKVLEVIIDTL